MFAQDFRETLSIPPAPAPAPAPALICHDHEERVALSEGTGDRPCPHPPSIHLTALPPSTSVHRGIRQ